MNNSTPTPKKITLEDIAQRKQEVLQEICDQKQAMADTTRRIFAPLAPLSVPVWPFLTVSCWV